MIQLTLPLSTPEHLTFGSLVVHPGIEEAQRVLRSMYGGPGPCPSQLFLFGESGTGKTHILKAVGTLIDSAAVSDQGKVEYTVPPGRDGFDRLERLVSESVDGLRGIAGVIVDDIHLLRPEDEPHLWSLSNKLVRLGRPLMTASIQGPETLFSANPHLLSRIRGGLVFRLDAPEDEARFLILDKMARDRNISLSPDVRNYLVTRKGRNVKQLAHIVEILDLESLRFKRRITIPFVRGLEKEGLV
ncbi:MAG: DnaA/Hda family protein [Pseudomonadota bacterium]